MKKRISLFISLFLSVQVLVAANYEDFVAPVYQTLYEAKGDFSQPLPSLKISDRIFNIAAYSKNTNKLIIEERAIEVCQSFQGQSKTALAFLLGHELTHFYQIHDGGFAFLLEESKFEKQLVAEREADINGAMLAYFAGYRDVVKVMPQLIDQLYSSYDLDNQNMLNYPTKVKRKALIEETVEMVNTLIAIYESGKYLAIAGQQSYAGDLYDYITQFIQTKELLNNQAIAYLSAASMITEFGKKNWYYPFNLDIHNPLRVPESVRRQILLKRARKNLEVALKYDATYFPAQLNYAITLTMQTNLSAGLEQLSKTEALAKTQQEVLSVRLIRAIILAQQGSKKQSAQLLDGIKKSGNDGLRQLAVNNLKLINGVPPPLEYQPVNFKHLGVKMDGVDLSLKPDLMFDVTINLSNDPFSPKSLKIKRLAQSILTLLETYDQSIAIQYTRQIIHKGMRPTTAVQQIKTIYNTEQSRIIPHSKGGFFMEFPNLGVIFQLDDAERLTEWAIYTNY